MDDEAVVVVDVADVAVLVSVDVVLVSVSGREEARIQK
jgi:hypothetical protein